VYGFGAYYNIIQASKNFQTIQVNKADSNVYLQMNQAENSIEPTV